MSKPTINSKRNAGFFKKIVTKYKVSIINESTLEETGHLRLSAMSLFAVSVALILFVLAAFSCIILFTPLKNYLPENVDETTKARVTIESMQIDSLTEVVELQNQYLDVLKDVISGDIQLDTTDTETKNLLAAKHAELLMEKSEAEKEFAKNYEDEEMYNLSNPLKQQTSILFFRPVKGIITTQFNQNKGVFGVDIATSADGAVSAAYKGLVFNVGYDYHTGYYIEIVHPSGYLTIYRGLGIVFPKCGENVETGQVIGTVFRNKNESKPQIHFELWSDAYPQDPQNYMVFE